MCGVCGLDTVCLFNCLYFEPDCGPGRYVKVLGHMILYTYDLYNEYWLMFGLHCTVGVYPSIHVFPYTVSTTSGLNLSDV